MSKLMLFVLLASLFAVAVSAVDMETIGPALGCIRTLQNYSLQPGDYIRMNTTIKNDGTVYLYNITINDTWDNTTLTFLSINETILNTGDQIKLTSAGFSSLAPNGTVLFSLNFSSFRNNSATWEQVYATAVDENGTFVSCGGKFFIDVAGDEYEPDSNYTQALPIPLNGSWIRHNFGVAGDVDWGYFNGRKGAIYLIETRNVTPWYVGGGNSTDTYLTLFDETLNVSSYNDDIVSGNNYNSRIVYQSVKSQKYYLRVHEANGAGNGTYDLRVQEIGHLSTVFNVSTDTMYNGFVQNMSANVTCAQSYCKNVLVTLDPQPVKDSLVSKLARGDSVDVIVKLKSDKSKDPSISRSQNKFKLDSVIGSLDVGAVAVKDRFDSLSTFSARLTEDGYNALLRNPNVVAIYPDGVVNAFLNETGTLLNATTVHNITVNGKNITGWGQGICVIDTGIAYSHMDFGNCTLVQVQSNTCPAIGPGYDFVNNDIDPLDDNGHGSHVSGIIASRDSVFSGMAPNARIFPLKVLNATGSGSNSNVIAAIDWCVTNATRFNISVISMSLGDDTHAQGWCDESNPFSDAVNTAFKNGIAVVAASGNDGYGSNIDDGFNSPACIKNVTSIGSATKNGLVSSFSNRAQGLDLLAPGSSIFSTDYSSSNGHKVLSGTSMATPHVAGIIALMQNYYGSLFGRSLNPSGIEQSLKLFGIPVTDSGATNLTFTRIQANTALSSKGIISTNSTAKPFWSMGSNPVRCGDMIENQTCLAQWTVNASGANGRYEFFAIVEQDFDINLSQKINVSIRSAPSNFNVSKTAPLFVNMSSNLTYSVNVSNDGLALLQNITVLDYFNPAHLSYVSSTIPALNTSSSLNFTVGPSLDAGQSFIFNITFATLNISSSANTTNNIFASSFAPDGGFNLSNNFSFVVEIRFINHVPVITTNASLNATSNSNYSYDVNATDGNNDVLVYSLSRRPANMTINSSNGYLNWVPSNSQVGLNNVTVSVTDGNGANTTQNFTINVTRSDTAPVITTSPEQNLIERALFTYDVNATDVDADTLLYTLYTYPLGMIINNVTGQIQWTPTNEQVGWSIVDVIVFDGWGGNATQSFLLNVSNVPPAFSSSAPGSANESILFTYDVNTTDEGLGNNTYSLIISPPGMIINSTTGIVTWTPNTSQIGPNNISILANDSFGGLTYQNFTINVSPVSSQSYLITIVPTPVNMSNVVNITLNLSNTGKKNLTNVVTYITFNATDVLFAGSSQTAASNSSGGVLFGPFANLTPNTSMVFSIQFLALNRTSNVSSSLNITTNSSDVAYLLSVSNISTVRIAIINYAPMIYSSPVTNAESGSKYLYQVNATDVNNDTLSYSLLQSPSGMSFNGTGALIWYPLFNQTGLWNVTFIATDGGLNATQSFILNITRNNSAPSLTTPPFYNVTQNASFTYDFNATDLENDTIWFALSVQPAGMSIDNVTGVISWTPSNAQVGTNNLTLRIFDSFGWNSTPSFLFNVSNILPVITTNATAGSPNGIVPANESILYFYDLNSTEENSGAVYTVIIGPPGMSMNATTGLISWTPNTTQLGLSNVSLQINDSNGGIITQNYTINVSPISDGLNLVVLNQSTTNMSSQLSVFVNFTNTGKKNLTDVIAKMTYNSSDFTFVTSSINFTSQSAGIILFGPYVNLTPNISSNFTVVFTAQNRTSNVTSLVNVTVNASDVAYLISKKNESLAKIATVPFPPSINSVPNTSAQSGTHYVYLVNASDVNNDTLSFQLPLAPAGMTINSTGAVSWYPLYNQSGLWNISVMVLDGKYNVSQNFTLNVTRNNSAPNITTQPIINVTEDFNYTYDINASDQENDTFLFNLTAGPSGMGFNQTTGVLTYAPNNSQVGVYTINISVTDALNASSNQSFTFTVINNPPNFTTSPLLFANESRVYYFDANTTDEGQGPVFYSLSFAPAGMIIDTNTGMVNWTPNTSQIGLSNVSIRFNDSSGGVIEQNFTVNVTRISNLTLSAQVSPSTINMSGNVNVLLNFTNNGAKNLTYPVLTVNWNSSDISFLGANYNYTFLNATHAQWENLTNLSQNVSIFLNITFTTANRSNNQSSNFTIAANAYDGVIGLQSNATLLVTILFVNYAPIINSTPVTTAQSGTAYFYQIQAYDNNGDNLSYSLSKYPFNMALNGTGFVSWYPLYNQSGLWNISLIVSDTRGANTTQNYTINVTRNNTAPNITSPAVLNATEDMNYTYDVNASDLENDSITFILSQFQAGMSINNQTGVITWLPANLNVGAWNITVNATDALGNSSSQAYMLTVSNTLANFTTSPSLTAAEQIQYSYDSNTTDEGSGPVLYSLNASPQGMTIQNTSGVLLWTPNTTQVGMFNISIIFDDNHGGIISQAWQLNVSDTTRPFINVTFPPNTTKYANPNITLNFSVRDNGQIASCVNSLNGVISTIFSGASSSQINVSTTINGSEGQNTLLVNCTDSYGNSQTSSTLFTVDTIAPALVVTSPINGSNTSGNIQVTYTISEPNFYNLTLVYGSQVLNLSQSGSFTLVVSEGLNQNFTLTAFDQLNHTNSSTLFFNIDRTPPRVVTTPNITVMIYDGRGAYVLLNASNASDNYALQNATWDFDSRDGVGIDALGFESFKNYSVPATFISTVTVTDVVGNQNTSRITIYVMRDSDGDDLPDYYLNGSIWDNCPLIADPTNNASLCVGDRDGDGIPDPIDFITGNVNHTITNFPNLSLQVADMHDPINYSGPTTVHFLSNNASVVSFPFNFTIDWSIWMNNVTLVGAPGEIVVRGLVMPPGITKSITFPKGNTTHNAVCVLDAQVETVSSMSSTCTAPNEFQINCTGSNAGYSCIDSGNYWTVTGVRFTAIRSLFISRPSSGPVFSGSGSSNRRFEESRSSGPTRSIPRYEAIVVKKEADTAQVVIAPPKQASSSKSVQKQVPTKQPIAPQSRDDSQVQVSSSDSVWVLLVAILIVLIGIAAIVYVWKM